MRRATCAVATALMLAVGLLGAPSALAHGLTRRVVLFHSIGGVAIGMTGRDVVHRIGHPSELEHYHRLLNDFYYARYSLSVSFDTSHSSNRVDQIQDDGAGWRTSKGIHSGSSRGALRHAYPGLRCQGSFCQMYRGRELSLKRLETQFLVERGRVVSLIISEPAGYTR